MKPSNRYRSALALVAMAASAWTGAAQAQEVREVPYRQDQVVRVNTGLGIATQIEISPQEQVKDFGTGFSDGWELVFARRASGANDEMAYECIFKRLK